MKMREGFHRLLDFFLWLYKATISPLLGDCCRFEPECSKYCVAALKKHGILRGGLLGLRRVCRCNPWAAGGVDPLP